MKHSALLLAFCMLISCQQAEKAQQSNSKKSIMVTPSDASEKTNQVATDSTMQVNRYVVSRRPSSDQVTRIDESCGLFIPIDTMKMNKLKGKTQSELDQFYVAADDLINYQYEAGKFLKKMNRKAVYPKTRYLEFVVSNGTVIFDTTPEQASGWGYVILYKKGSMPVLVDAIDVPTAYPGYFEN